TGSGGGHTPRYARLLFTGARLRNNPFIARTIQRIRNTMITRNTIAIAAAQYGCFVANHVRKIARASSLKLSVMFEKGSGEGVTAVRTAVFPPCAANAINPPTTVAASCFSGERCEVAA